MEMAKSMVQLEHELLFHKNLYNDVHSSVKRTEPKLLFYEIIIWSWKKIDLNNSWIIHAS